jgi:hypothetical protein
MIRCRIVFDAVMKCGVHFHDMPTVRVKVNPPKASNEQPKGQFVEPHIQREAAEEPQ